VTDRWQSQTVAWRRKLSRGRFYVGVVFTIHVIAGRSDCVLQASHLARCLDSLRDVVTNKNGGIG
jgi:hypothetical protein